MCIYGWEAGACRLTGRDEGQPRGTLAPWGYGAGLERRERYICM